MEKCGMTYDHFSEKELTYLDVPRDLTYYVIKEMKSALTVFFEDPFGQASSN